MIAIDPHFLASTQRQSDITSKSRENLFLWMLDVSTKSKFNIETLQRAFSFVDIMLSAFATSTDALYLIGISALVLSSKLEESQIHSQGFLYQILREAQEDAFFSESGISSEKIVKCESAILYYCNWRPLVPTCIEILKLLLNITN